jgi:hypothetical protein
MMRLLRGNYLFSLSFLLCLGLGCGGSGGSKNGTSSQNPVPTLTGVTPNSATAGSSALTLTVTGSSFVPASMIDWNGAPLSTTPRPSWLLCCGLLRFARGSEDMKHG